MAVCRRPQRPHTERDDGPTTTHDRRRANTPGINSSAGQWPSGQDHRWMQVCCCTVGPYCNGECQHQARIMPFSTSRGQPWQKGKEAHCDRDASSNRAARDAAAKTPPVQGSLMRRVANRHQSMPLAGTHLLSQASLVLLFAHLLAASFLP